MAESRFIITADTEQALRELERFRAEATRSMNDVGAAGESLLEMFKELIAPVASVAAALGLLHEVIRVQREFDGMNASLITATGSAKNADQAFTALQQFAATTPYGLAEVTKAFVQMRSLGLDPSERALRSYGNTAGALGKSLDQMVEAVADAATGEFERLKEFGIKAKQNGDTVALTFQGVTTVVGNSATEIEGYLQKLGDTTFAGGMELRAATLDGAISNLGDTWESTLLKISQGGVGDAAQAGVLALSGSLTDLVAILDAATGAASREGKSIAEAAGLHVALTTVFESVTVLGANVYYVLKQVGLEIAGLAAQATLVAQGEFKQAKALGDQMKLDAEAARKEIDERSEAILGASEKAAKAAAAAAAEKKESGRDDLAQYKTVQSAAEQAAEAERKRGDLLKKYATDQEQLTAELKKWKLELGGAFTPADEARIRKHFAEKDEGSKKAAAAAKQETEAYTSLTTAVSQKIAESAREAAGEKPYSEAQKLQIALDEQLRSGKLKLSAAHKTAYEDLIHEYGANLTLAESQKSVAKAVDALTEERASAYAATLSEAQANEQLVATFGMSKSQIEAMTVARLEDRLAQRAALELDEKEVAQLEMTIAAKKRNAAALGQLETLDTGSDLARAKDLLDVMSRLDEVASDAAAGMAASFGAVGTAIGGLTTALTGYGKAQAAIAAELAAATNDAHGDPTKLKAAETKAAESSARAQIKQYGDMASAAKGFFKENSAGYKVMEGAEKAYRAYEMAMALESMVKKIFFKEGEVAANVALNATKLTGEAATTAVSTGLAATEASAWGITAVVKALASLPFPLNLAAGAATLAAVVAIGASMLGGGGSSSASISETRQKSNGTGTVLGDSTAKSESISNSLALVADNTYRDLNISAGMLASLRKIESSVSGLGNLIVRGTGITGAAAADTLGGAQNLFNSVLGNNSIGEKLTGGLVGKVIGSIFGGGTTVLDTGLTASKGSLGSVLSGGVVASQYTDTKKDGGLFHSDKYKTQLTGLGDEVDEQFSSIISAMASGVGQAADVLGLGGDAFVAHLNSFVVDLGKISLKDLTGDQIQEALETAFSKLGDDMAKFAVGGLTQFQQVGEGAYETLVRIANDYATVDAVLGSFGESFGAVGMQSVAARERLIDLSGGLEDFVSQGSFFLENYFTDAEKAATLRASLNAQLTPINGGVEVTTMEQFKNLALAQDLTTESGAQTYATLMSLATAFKQLSDYGDAAGNAIKSTQEILDERKDLQDKLDELTMTAAQLRAKERDTIAESNRALYDQISARQDLANAYATESDALKSTIDRLKTFAASIDTFKNGLVLGNLSTLTPLQKMVEAQRQYEDTLAKAQAGDVAAQAALTAAASAYLTADQVVKSSTDAYAADAAKVQADLAALSALAGAQMSDAQQQLDALDKQVGQLINLNDTAVSTRDAILALGAALRADGKTDITAGMDGSHATGLVNVPFDGYRAETHKGEAIIDAGSMNAFRRYFGATPRQGGGGWGGTGADALVAEVKALRAEVKGLRDDAERQSGEAIVSNYDANERAAAKVAAGVKAGAKDSVWAAANPRKAVPA